MFGLGMGELLVIFAVALLVFGPKRLPDLANGLGKAIRQFRRATRDLQDQLEIDESVRRPIQELRSALRDEPAPPGAPAPRIGPPAATRATVAGTAPSDAPATGEPPTTQPRGA